MKSPNPCQTRIDLLDAAEALFGACGYDAVGIREIASRANTNIASIKYHFGSKHELYLETVSRAMSRPSSSSHSDTCDTVWQWFRAQPPPEDDLAAAAMLGQFIHRFLAQLLPTAGDDACGMLLIREGMQPSEAIDAVVNQYLRPNQTLLVRLLTVIKPEADPGELARDAQCILGQILHYRVFRAIIERLNEQNLSYPESLTELSQHLTRFTLRGLGCRDAFIDRAIAAAAPLPGCQAQGSAS